MLKFNVAIEAMDGFSLKVVRICELDVLGGLEPRSLR